MTLRPYDKPRRQSISLEYKDPAPEMYSDEWFEEGRKVREKHEAEIKRNAHGHPHSEDPYHPGKK